MKVTKLNKELWNIYYKTDGKLYGQKVDDKVYVSDSYRVWILKDVDFILDICKLKTVELTKFFENDQDYIKGYKTNELVEKDKCVGVYITNEDKSIKLLVNQKYLDVFENYTLKMKSEQSPVFVYEHDELVGLILPMRMF